MDNIPVINDEVLPKDAKLKDEAENRILFEKMRFINDSLLDLAKKI